VAEYVIAGVGIVADDGDGSQVPVAGDGIVAEAAVVAADEISSKFAARLYYKGLGRNPYLFHRAKDETFVPPAEPETLAPHLVRVPFRGYKRNRYLHNPSVEGGEQLDDSGAGPLVVPNWDVYRLTRASRLYYYNPARDVPVVVEPETGQPFLVRLPFKAYKPNRYRFNTAQDFSIPPEGEHRRDFLIRLPFKRYAHNRYRFHVSPHDSVVIPPEPPPGHGHPPRPKDRLEARYKFAMGARTRYNFHHATDGGVVVAGFKAWWAEDVNLIVEDDGITR
jgi:hypothetical protein